VDELVVKTEVYAAPETVYEFLVDFPQYAQYSEYLETVETLTGEGGPGTRYALQFAWWKLAYTTRSMVTDVEPPARIDWRITKDIDAGGCWRVTPHGTGPGGTDPADMDPAGTNPADTDPADTDPKRPGCTVALEVEFDPSSASPAALDLPRLVSFEWVIKKAVPLIKSEAERVVERAVRDLEGSSRSVELEVYVDSDRI